jgi:octaprenyl-diphosphate synthase
MSALTSVTAEQWVRIGEHVARVERELERGTASEVDLVGAVTSHTLRAGGKRLRPAFVALAAESAGGADRERVIRLGACMEMIHMATLIHDDVIDGADTRRGRATAAAVFGNTASILSGDVLLARAMAILAADGDLEIIRVVSASVVEMAEGEVRELETRGCFDLTENEHLAVLRMKTAAFVQCCCEVGALIAGAAPEWRAALAAYGHHVGMAFQIADDLLDFRGDKSETGKPFATDFREGCATLPLIHLRGRLNPEEDSFVRHKFGNGVSEEELEMIASWMDSRGAFALAEDCASAHAVEARLALGALPASEARDLLAAVADYVVARRS